MIAAMEQRSSDRLKRGLPLTALVAGLAVLALLLVNLSGRLPGSPEELFAEFQRLNAAGDHAGIWALMDEEGHSEYRDAIDNARIMLERNPHASNDSVFLKRHLRREEFMRLSYEEIWAAENSDPEMRRWMVGARILKLLDYPGQPQDTIIRWERTDGQLFNFQARDTGRGYTWVRQMPYGRPDSAKAQ